jgi:methionyl aminopeptidase
MDMVLFVNWCGHGLGQKCTKIPKCRITAKEVVVNYLLKEWLSLWEPMINQGTRNIKQLKDGWITLTADGNHLPTLNMTSH